VNDGAFVAEQRGELELFHARWLTQYDLDVVVTTRVGGVSSGTYSTLNLGDHVGDEANAVHENRTRLAHAMGVELSQLVIVRQVHGTDVVDGDGDSSNESGDAIVLRKNERAAAILVADCVPLVMLDRAAHTLIVVHAGWRGLASGVIGAAVGQLTNLDDVIVAIGPSISRDAYQVGPEVASQFEAFPDALCRDVEDRWRLDLRHVARLQLHSLGVRPTNIETMDASTDGAETFFSDRAQRPCGRFALAAKWSS
jgi:YfiH family protein